jgi:hypothetical protein
MRQNSLLCRTPYLPCPIVSSLRIVSLVPSLTELVVELGLGDYLVGRTGFCIHPAGVVGRIAKVGGTKTVNIDKIRALAPSHVLVNVDENTLPTVQSLRAFVPHVVVTHPQRPADNLALIDQLIGVFQPYLAANLIAQSALFNCGKALKAQISQGMAALEKSQAQPTACAVLYLIWRDPWMTVAQDTYISQMLGLIGWSTLPAVTGGDGLNAPGATRYPVLRGDEVWLAKVQRVLLSSEPYSFGLAHVHEVQAWLPHTKVQLVDGEMLSWYGSRAVAGLDYLRTLSSVDCTGGAADASPSPE